MAAFGGIATGTAAGAVTTLDTGNLNATGSNLALVCGAWEDEGDNDAISFTWDPAGNNEAMTGTFATVSTGSFLDSELGFLDNPTAANAPARVTFAASVVNCNVFAAFFTAAGDIVGADTATDVTGDTTPSVTVPNVVSGDMVVDFMVATHSSTPTLTVGADQTDRANLGDGAYTQMAVSTQLGSVDGVMTWTINVTPTYGSILIGARIPDVPSVGGPPLRIRREMSGGMNQIQGGMQ